LLFVTVVADVAIVADASLVAEFFGDLYETIIEKLKKGLTLTLRDTLYIEVSSN